MKEQLTCTDTVLLKSDRLVVPATLQERIVDIAHEGHLGIVKTKALLRETVNIYRPTEADATNRNPTPVTTVTIRYIKGTSETISRILQPYNIRVAHKPTTTLRHLLINVKDRDEPNNRQGAVYKIKCSNCQASYIGETGRNLNTRLTEHKRATRNGDVNNHIDVHHQLTTLTGTLLSA